MKKLIPLLTLALAACGSAETAQSQDNITPSRSAAAGTDTAILAGGCFWCVESDFEKLPGVIEAVSGYTGGHTENPTYKQVSHTETGHYEAAKITFDPAVISYRQLLDYYWKTVDPTDPNGQFCDQGNSYRTAIFARPDQIDTAKASLSVIQKTKPFDAPIVTPLLPATTFYDAEDYHQDYYKKNSFRYKGYRRACGRDKRLKNLWGK